MGVHLGGDGKDRGGVPENGGADAATTEHGRTVHPYTITARPVWGVGEGTGGQMGVQWWEQAGINLAGSREVKATAEEAEEEGGKE